MPLLCRCGAGGGLMVAAMKPTPINDTAAATMPSDRSPQDVANLLRRPFAAHVIKQRQIAGRSIEYAPIDAVIERLNKAAPQWIWRVTGVQILTMPIVRKGTPVDMPVAHVTGELEIPGLGRRQGIGTAPCEGTEDATKIAESDAIKRAATMFGIPSGR